VTPSDTRVREVLAAADRLAPELDALSRRIHAHPEVGFAEVRATAWLAQYLAAHGYAVQREASGVATAFRLSWTLGAPPRGEGRRSPSWPSTTRSPASGTAAAIT